MTDRWLLGPLATCLTLVPLSVNAQNAPETRCVQGDLQRRVVIFYETGVPTWGNLNLHLDVASALRIMSNM